MNSAVVLDKRPLGNSLFLLTLRPLKPFSFKAGQFVIIPVPADPNAPSPPKPPKGFYSIASAEQNPRELELLVEHREGYVSSWMTRRRGGDIVGLDGPMGKFGRDQRSATQAYLAFKAGLAPLRSMILSQLYSGLKGQVHLFLGQPDLLFDSEWREFSERFPNFHYHPSVDPAASLAEAVPVRDIDIYTAGFNREIDPMLATLEAAGFNKSLVKAEKFG